MIIKPNKTLTDKLWEEINKLNQMRLQEITEKEVICYWKAKINDNKPLAWLFAYVPRLHKPKAQTARCHYCLGYDKECVLYIPKD